MMGRLWGWRVLGACTEVFTGALSGEFTGIFTRALVRVFPPGAKYLGLVPFQAHGARQQVSAFWCKVPCAW